MLPIRAKYGVMISNVRGTAWMSISVVLLAVVGIVALVILGPSSAQAQPLTLTSGPFVVISDEVAGDYRITVYQSPERVIIGTLTYAVQVRLAGSDEFVDDAFVRVYGTPSEGGTRQVGPALNTPASPEWYVGRIEVEESGVWAIDVVVEHDDHGYANATLAVEVFERSRGGSNLALGTTLWVLVSLAFLGAVGYVIYSGRRNLRRMRQGRTG